MLDRGDPEVSDGWSLTPAGLAGKTWHALSAASVCALLGTGPSGLDEAEAGRRAASFGPNRLTPPKRRGPLARFALQFHSVLIYVLLGASLATALLGEWVDTGVIIGVVVINALIGFIQEGKAEQALAGIRDLLAPNARVVRAGRRQLVPADALVPGDVVLLQSGDKVPADLRLVEVKSLRIQEAALTGESIAVEKATEPVAAEAALGDRRSIAYAGTLVVYGRGRAVVTATGDASEIGRLGAMLAEVQPLETPLLRQIAAFARQLTAGILGIAAVTFAFGLLVRDYTAADMLLAAVAVAVAAIPEGLPAIMTITLALGVQSMASRRAIVRRLPAVETLGSVSVICTDKTGTLTRNEMTVQWLVTPVESCAVTGVGYAPDGTLLVDGAAPAAAATARLEMLLRAALLCNEAHLEHAGDEWRIDGDPTEGALLTAARKAGLDLDDERRAWPRLDLVPFEAEHRFMASLHAAGEGRLRVFMKGAPEAVLARCRAVSGISGEQPLDLMAWRQRADALAANGQRVLAIAMKPAGPEETGLGFDALEGFVLLGLVGMIDPARTEAIAAIRDCRSAGIRVKMITGDHASTARAIATGLGLANTAEVATGVDLDDLPDERLPALAARIDVFARTSPLHKLRLVEALQAQGVVTAMTGDGVNDAPALKRADVGVAMGRRGTEAAKEAAEIVLADDDFASIAAAVEEGRKVYDNIRKSILFILPTSAAEALTIMLAVLFGYVLPITPVQILWINMITAVTLGLALAFEPAEDDVMARPPRPAGEALLSRFLLWRTGFVALLLLAGTFGLFVEAETGGDSLERARTIAVNMLVLFEIVYLVNCRRMVASVVNRSGLLGSRAVLIAIATVLVLQMLFTYAPPMQALFGAAPLGLLPWLKIALAAGLVFALIELEKAWQRRRGRRRAWS
jgi:magnesium-transporting ATPase (P-type)